MGSSLGKMFYERLHRGRGEIGKHSSLRGYRSQGLGGSTPLDRI